jgi:hypothetical protein
MTRHLVLLLERIKAGLRKTGLAGRQRLSASPTSWYIAEGSGRDDNRDFRFRDPPFLKAP